MPKLKIRVHRLTDYFLANTETRLTLSKIPILSDWVFSKIALRKYDLTQGAQFVLFFWDSRRRDVVGCSGMANTLPQPVYSNTTIWHHLLRVYIYQLYCAVT